MIRYLLTIVALFVFAVTLVAGDSGKNRAIVPGILLSSATDILSSNGKKKIDAAWDIETVDHSLDSAFFQIDDEVLLEVSYKKDSQIIHSLHCWFVPKYRPVKGVEVVREIQSMSFNPEGSVGIVFKTKAESKKFGTGNSP